MKNTTMILLLLILLKEYYEYYTEGNRCPPFKRVIGDRNNSAWVLKTFPLPDTPAWLIASFTKRETQAIESSDKCCYSCSIKGIQRARNFCYYHCRCCTCEGFVSGEYPIAYVCDCVEGPIFEHPEEPVNNCDECKAWLRLDRSCPNAKCKNNCVVCGLAKWWGQCPNDCVKADNNQKVSRPVDKKNICRHFLQGKCRYENCKFSHSVENKHASVLTKPIKFVPASDAKLPTDIEMKVERDELIVRPPTPPKFTENKPQVNDDRVNLLIETFENLNFQCVTSKSPGHLNPGYIASFLEWLGFNMKVSVKSEVVRRIGNIGDDLRNDFAQSMDCKHKDPLLVVVRLTERIGFEILKFKIFLPWKSFNKELLVSYEAFTQIIQGPSLNFLSPDAVNYLTAFRSDRVLSTVLINRYFTDELRHATQMLAFKRIEFVKAQMENVNVPSLPLNSEGLSTGTTLMRSTRPNSTVRGKMLSFLKSTAYVGLGALFVYLLVTKCVAPVIRSLMGSITLTPLRRYPPVWDVTYRSEWYQPPDDSTLLRHGLYTKTLSH